MTLLTALAPAKVNLTLHVGPLKENGRHDLDSLTVFAGPQAADRITVEPADTLQLAIIGPYADACGNIGDNLVFKAARALQSVLESEAGARLTLVKHLPVAAGIGGGSADAGAALRLLNRMWGGPDTFDHLLAIAAQLGGDVPACTVSQPVLMRGEGERLTGVKLPGPVPALLANPNIACPTGPIFNIFDAANGGAGFTEAPLPSLQTLNDLFGWLEGTFNDLEAPAMTRHPEIARTLAILRDLPKGRFVRMSGSGATCFVLFETLAEAKAAETTLKADRPNWWSAATELGGQ